MRETGRAKAVWQLTPQTRHYGLPSEFLIADIHSARQGRGMTTPIQAGDILTVSWDNRPIRVLQIDAIETFYDAEMEEFGWVIAKARTAIYFRISTLLLKESASVASSQSFSPKEDKKYRPDLPMRLFRHHGADWSDELSELTALEDDFSIPAQEVVIIPFGAKGGATKPVKLQTSDGGNLTLREIIEAAHSAQQSKCTDVKGVGLYRSGFVGGVPSYYLWGAVDRAGHSG